MYYNRETDTCEDIREYRDGALNVLYKTVPGRVVLWTVAARPWFSKVVSVYQKSRLSHKDIAPFIERYHIDVSKEYADEHFKSFNDFFTRTRPIDTSEKEENILISPADSKMRYFEITDDLVLDIKNSKYQIKDIIGDEKAAEAFKGGTCIVYQLSVDDYHRYHFIDDGTVLSTKRIKGRLHTVRPIAEKYKVYTRNSREVTMMETENFGTVAQIDVGALLVGKIRNHNIQSFERFQEKGYFEFGGSTIVLLINKEIQFDPDIVEANNKGLKVKVHAGERVGVCTN